MEVEVGVDRGFRQADINPEVIPILDEIFPSRIRITVLFPPV